MINLKNEPLFEESKTTLKETSKNDSNIKNISHMTEFEIEVIDFDTVKEKYCCTINPDETPKSNDALMELDNELYFIEFKDGNIGKELYSVRRKIFESLLVFSDITNKTISFTREHMNYILVYNREKSEDLLNKIISDRKNADKNELEKKEIQESTAFDSIVADISVLAEYSMDIFGLKRQFAKMYFKNVYTYDKTEFENTFVKHIM